MDEPKSKSQAKREAVMGHAEPSARQFTHRYFCDGCTGVAFMHVEGETLPKTVKCHACGKVQAFKPENLIKL